MLKIVFNKTIIILCCIGIPFLSQFSQAQIITYNRTTSAVLLQRSTTIISGISIFPIITTLDKTIQVTAISADRNDAFFYKKSLCSSSWRAKIAIKYVTNKDAVAGVPVVYIGLDASVHLTEGDSVIISKKRSSDQASQSSLFKCYTLLRLQEEKENLPVC